PTVDNRKLPLTSISSMRSLHHLAKTAKPADLQLCAGTQKMRRRYFQLLPRTSSSEAIFGTHPSQGADLPMILAPLLCLRVVCIFLNISSSTKST
ncbi:hypothetical protein PHLCEN_2v3259, partial [Hermanssonia centrifuga]